MNHPVNGTAGMSQDSTTSHSNGYGHDQWPIMSPYSQSPYGNSPVNEYGNFAFMPHALPSESLGRMPPPPHQHQQHQQHHQPQPQPQHHQMIQPGPPPPASSSMAHQQLPMLNTTWPSQLTNPTPQGSYSAPPLSITPLSSAPAVEMPRPTPQNEKARKTLSNEQKRAMCQFAEDNAGMRQADIGARFGVERSTVSKVLRHKDQYLKRDQETENASLKRKGKHPDLERTLTIYIQKRHQRGFDITDQEIMEQAQHFATVSGNSDNSNTINETWLLKFKQKHGIGTGRLMRRASEANIPDSARMSTTLRGAKREKRSSRVSPISPTTQLSPLSGSRSEEDIHGMQGDDYDFPYRQAGSHSTTSLTSDLRDAGNSSFSGSAMSPSAPFFSPDPNVGGFPIDHNLQLRGSVSDFHHREKRSNTFPSLNIDLDSPLGKGEPLTPRHPTSSTTAPSSALESPVNEIQAAPFGIDTTLRSPPILHHSGSNSSLTGRSANASSNSNANSSTPVESPVSPSQEDARRAATTLLSYIQNMSSNGQFDQNEYLAIVQLTKKLQIQQHQSSRPSIGGLSRIPEGDVEMPGTTDIAMEQK